MTGGLGSGREHGEVRADIERADARLLAASLQRDLLTPMVRLNFGADRQVPKLKIGREEDWDAGAMMPAVASFVAMGGRVEKSVIGDKLGLPDAPAGNDEALLRPAARPIAPAEPTEAEKTPVQRRLPSNGPEMPEAASTGFLGGSLPSYSAVAGRGDVATLVAAAVGARVAEKLGGNHRPDPVDEAARYLGAEWEEILSPMVDPVFAAIQAASTYEEAVAAMTAALDDMDTGPLEDAVARGSLLARAETVAARSASNEALAAHSDETRAKLADVARRRQREKGRFAEEGWRLGELARTAEENRDRQETHDLGPVNRSAVEVIWRDGRMDVAANRLKLSDDQIRHALRGHQDFAFEHARGQRPLRPEDFATLGRVIAKPDSATASGRLHRGHRAIVLHKLIENEEFHVTLDHVATKSEIRFVTMFVRKK